MAHQVAYKMHYYRKKKLNQSIKHGIIKTVDGMSVLLTEQYYQPLKALWIGCRHTLP